MILYYCCHGSQKLFKLAMKNNWTFSIYEYPFFSRFHLATDDFFVPSILGSLCRFVLLSFYVGVHVYASIASSSPPGNGTTPNDTNSIEAEILVS